jgi:hypothetical protein
MKLYNVYVYNYVGSFAVIYMVKADDPVDARSVAVQRMIVDVNEVKGVPQA